MPSMSWGAARASLAAIVAVSTISIFPSGVAGAACPAPSTGSVPLAPMPGSGAIVFRGSGLGHQMGMSQYGARGAALLGCSSTTILRTYYQGSHPVTMTMPSDVGVWMVRGGTRAKVIVPRDPTKRAIVRWRWNGTTVGYQRERQMWTVRRSGASLVLVDHEGNELFRRREPLAPLLLQHSGDVTRLRTYAGPALVRERLNKWDFTSFAYRDGVVDVQQWFRDRADNGLGMDKYLYGLAEVPTGWPAAALQAQAVAGRTFAAKVARVMYPDSSDQTYGGHDPSRDRPSSPWRRAVDATSQRVMVGADGRLIDALYSASMAGYTEDRRYVWGGTTEIPHLTAVDDSAWANASSDPYAAWARGFTRSHVAGTFGFDAVRNVTVGAKGTSARWSGVAITGTDGGATVTRRFTGWDVKSRLGLPSPGFVVTVR